MPVHPYVWEQGEDLIIEVIYKVNDVAVEMTMESHAVRMDIAPKPAPPVPTGPPIFSFNSDDLDDSPLDEEGPDDNEVTFPESKPGAIHIKVPRALTLPGGAIGESLETTRAYEYDLFIRDKISNLNRKLLRGTITINPSVTHWQ